MPTRGNKHIRQFNQLVTVYDPDPVDQIAVVATRDKAKLQQRRTEIQCLREQVAQLTVEDFFSPTERAEMQDNDGLPAPDEVVQSHREDMVARLDEVETALSAALETSGRLDATDDLTL